MLDEYLDYIKSVKHMSIHTIRAYRRDILRFLEFLTERELSEDQEIDFSVVRSFISMLSREGMASRSINRIISGVRNYYRYKKRLGSIKKNPFDGYKQLKTEKWLPSFLFEEEVNTVLSEPKRDSFWGLRDVTIFEFLYSTGCRVSEAVRLDVQDIDLKRRLVRILGKGNKERTVFVGNFAFRCLNEYLLERQSYVQTKKSDERQALFINRRGGRISDRGVRYVLSKYLGQLKIDKRITPHTFRHSFATHILNRGADIRIVQELLGHSSLSTTQVYTHVGLEKLKTVYLESHPHARRNG